MFQRVLSVLIYCKVIFTLLPPGSGKAGGNTTLQQLMAAEVHLA